MVDRVVPVGLLPVVDRLRVFRAVAPVERGRKLILHDNPAARRRLDERFGAVAHRAEYEVRRVAHLLERDRVVPVRLGDRLPVAVAPDRRRLAVVGIGRVVGERHGNALFKVDLVRELSERQLGLHAPALARQRLFAGAVDIGDRLAGHEVLAERRRVDEAQRRLDFFGHGDLVENHAVVFAGDRRNLQLDRRVGLVRRRPRVVGEDAAVDLEISYLFPSLACGAGRAVERHETGAGRDGRVVGGVEPGRERDRAYAALLPVGLERRRVDRGIARFNLDYLVDGHHVVRRIVEPAVEARAVLAEKRGVVDVHAALGVGAVADGADVPAAPRPVGERGLVGDGHAGYGDAPVGRVLRLVGRGDDRGRDDVGRHVKTEDPAHGIGLVVVPAEIDRLRARGPEVRRRVLRERYPRPDGFRRGPGGDIGEVDGVDRVVVAGRARERRAVHGVRRDLDPYLGVRVHVLVGERHAPETAENGRPQRHRPGRDAARRLQHELSRLERRVRLDDALRVDEPPTVGFKAVEVGRLPLVLLHVVDDDIGVVTAGRELDVPRAGYVERHVERAREAVARNLLLAVFHPVRAGSRLRLQPQLDRLLDVRRGADADKRLVGNTD